MTKRSFTVFYNISYSCNVKKLKRETIFGEQFLVKKASKIWRFSTYPRLAYRAKNNFFSDLEHLSRQRRFILYKCAKIVQGQKSRQFFSADVLICRALEMIENDILLYLCLWNYVLTQIKYEDKLIITPTRLLREKKNPKPRTTKKWERDAHAFQPVQILYL